MSLAGQSEGELNTMYKEAVKAKRWSLCERIELEFVRRLIG